MQKEIRNKWWILISCALVGFFLDWLTKSSAARLLQEGEPVRLLGDYLELVLVYNKGAIFGLDPRHLIPGFPVNLFFAVFMSLAIVLLIVYFARLRKNEIGMHWGLALILPGAMGNLFDRIIHPQMGVVDFIKMGISSQIYWPVYNFADIYVTIGVGLIVICMVRDEFRRKKRAPSVETSLP